jgi:hypothetical protein
LIKCLEAPLVPKDWFKILNNNVFFWLDARRLDRLLGARAYRDTHHCVLTIDTARLVNKYSRVITLSPMNSGSTIYRPLPRGKRTFTSIADFPFKERRASRLLENTVVELLVKYSVPDVADFVLRVDERKGAKVQKVLFNQK